MMGKLRKWLKPACVSPSKDIEAKNRWEFHGCCEDEGTFSVSLHKCKQEKTFGLTISGGCDKDRPPYISAIRRDGLAYKSNFFSIGDLILSLGGTNVMILNHHEIVKIVQNAGGTLSLKIKYTLTKREKELRHWKTSKVLLRNDLMIPQYTIKGGATGDASFSRPVIIDSIFKDSNLEKSGVVFAGDEIIKIHSILASVLTFNDLNNIYQEIPTHYHLEIKYETHTATFVQTGENIFVGDLTIPGPNIPVGIILNVALDFEEQGSGIIISEIIEGSIAERCGQLDVGDFILSINNISMEGISLQQASQIISNSPSSLRLEVWKEKIFEHDYIIPHANPTQLKLCNSNNSRDDASEGSITKSESNLNYSKLLNMNKKYETLDSKSDSLHYSLQRKSLRQNSLPNQWSGNSLPNQWSGRKHHNKSNHNKTFDTYSLTSTIRKKLSLNVNKRVETVEILLSHKDIGIEVSNDFEFTCSKHLLVVDKKENNIPSKLDIIQIGDRIIKINEFDTSFLNPVEFQNILDEIELPIRLTVEFDVSDSVIPTQGLFSVKIPGNNNNSIGLVLKRPGPKDEEQYLRISDIEKGSSSYRLGILECGDQLISINKQSVSHVDPAHAYKLIKQSRNFVEMTFKKDECLQGPTFSIELARQAETLGITIAGSEHPFDPIYISEMSEDGLAYKSNAIQLGDVILAINDISLRGKSLQESYEILQQCHDKIKFLIKRNIKTKATKNTEEKDEPQVWTWCGDDPVHVVNHHSSISLVFDKESREDTTDFLRTSSESDHDASNHDTRYRSRFRKANHSYQTPIHSRQNSLPNSRRNSSSGKKSTPSLLEQEILEVAMKGQTLSPKLRRKNLSSSSLPQTARRASLVYPSKLLLANNKPPSPQLLRQNLSSSSLPLAVTETSPVYQTKLFLKNNTHSPKLHRKNCSVSNLPAPIKQLSPLVSSSDNISSFVRETSEAGNWNGTGRFAVGPSPSSMPSLLSENTCGKNIEVSFARSFNDNLWKEEYLGNNVQSYNINSNLPYDTGLCGALKNAVGRLGTNSGDCLDNDDDVFFMPSVDKETSRTSSHHNMGGADVYPSETPLTPNYKVKEDVIVASQSNNQLKENSPNLVTESLTKQLQSEKQNFFKSRMHQYKNAPLKTTGVTPVQSVAPVEKKIEGANYTGSKNVDEKVVASNQMQLHTVVLKKLEDSDNFGFSVSDSVRNIGVFVRSIEPGSLADVNGNIKKFDRVLKVNGVDTREMNCSTIVPLLQTTGNILEIEIERRTKFT